MRPVAVPSSKTNLRSSIPPAAVITHTPMPVGHDSGDSQAPTTSRAASSAIRNGAAALATPAMVLSSSWLLRPMITNRITAGVSKPMNRRIRRAQVAVRCLRPGPFLPVVHSSVT